MPARFGGTPAPAGPAPVLITGTAPVLGELTDGDLLGEAAAWGSYSSPRGPVDCARQMQRDGGAWLPFEGDIVVREGEVWALRELVSDGTSTRDFTSAPAVVLARAAAPAILGGVGEIVIAVPPDVFAPAVSGGTGAIIIGA